VRDPSCGTRRAGGAGSLGGLGPFGFGIVGAASAVANASIGVTTRGRRPNWRSSWARP